MANRVTNLHLDAALTEILLAVKPTGFVAENILPVVGVKKENDKYTIWDVGDTTRPSGGQGALRADGARASAVQFAFSQTSYSCEEYALEVQITDRQRDNADDQLKLEEAKTSFIQRLLLLEQEARVVTLLEAGITAKATPSPLWDAASATVQKDVDTGRETIRQATGGLDPNVIVISSPVAKALKRESGVLDLIKYTHADLLVDGDLPPVLWGMKVFIAKAAKTSSKKGQTRTVADVWGEDCFMAYIPEATSILNPSMGYTLRKGFKVTTWREDATDSDWYRVSYIQDEVVTMAAAGYRLEACLT